MVTMATATPPLCHIVKWRWMSCNKENLARNERDGVEMKSMEGMTVRNSTLFCFCHPQMRIYERTALQHLHISFRFSFPVFLLQRCNIYWFPSRLQRCNICKFHSIFQSFHFTALPFICLNFLRVYSVAIPINFFQFSLYSVAIYLLEFIVALI